jgi:PAS domain S-box-containing protein
VKRLREEDRIRERISEFEETERKLRESEQRFRDIAYSAGEYIWESDVHGRYTLVTERIEGILGVCAEHLIGRTPFEFMPRDEARTMERWFRDLVATGRPFHNTEHPSLNAAGNVVWQRISGTPILDDTGRVTGYRGTGLDITHLKQAEHERALVAKQLQQALMRAQSTSEFKSRFLANMSHEIRTPMTAILGYADMLRIMPGVAGEVAECARAILSNADHLLALLNDILDLSKIEAGQLTVERRPCDPAAVVESVSCSMRAQAVEKMLSLHVECDPTVPRRVVTDPVRLRQVLSNLLSNAIKFTEEGSVTVRLTADEDVLRFQVADTGIGIPAEELDTIFEPFTQARTELHHRYAGTGLGLDISSRLADMLGGSLTARSEPAQGSVFELRIPHVAPDVAAPDSPAGTEGESADAAIAVELQGRRVAIIDDSPDNRHIVRFLLEHSGAEVCSAADGSAGVRLVLEEAESNRPFDLILMDIQMPVMDGYEATRRLREARVETPIVALTAHAMAGDEERCLEMGCTGYVSKPIVPQTLMEVIDEQLREARPEAPPNSVRLDRSVVASLAQNPEFQALRTAYIESLTATAESMREAHARQDHEALLLLVHRLAGTAGSYGFPEITAAARACQDAIRAEAEEDATNLTRRLVRMLQSVHAHGLDAQARRQIR